LVRARLNEAR